MEKTINIIRNVLRKEGITGMDSINHSIIFLVSRILNKKLCKKFSIDTVYAFKNITKDDNGEELGDQDFYNRIYNGKESCLIGQIMIVLGFKNIKFKLEGIHNLKHIYNKLKDLDTEKLSSDYDLIGTIYEYHLKSGTSNSMRDLGQYYTNRLVINYMIELCKPKVEDGVIEKIVDPTMGTGGFLTMAIKYLNRNYKDIDWKKNKNRLIGFDIDDNVKNMALLNVFLEIGELCSNTLIKQDTLRNDMKFTNDGTILEKTKIILANEPMGLKNIIHANCCDRIKNLKIRGTKAEPLFLQLFMEALDDGGRCAVIVPDGILFNESNQHKQTRKMLIENFNLKKVISLNDDFFLNTGVKTSILFFENDGNKTKKVDFCEIKLVDNKIEEKSIIKVKYNKIKDNHYTLFVNKYNCSDIQKSYGIKYYKICDICNIQFGKRVIRKEVDVGKNYTGIKYPCYGGGGISFYTKEYNRDGETTVISRFGVSEKCVRLIDGRFWLNDSGFTISSKKENIVTNKYIGHCCFTLMKKNIYNMSVGACQKNLQMDNFKNLEIPIPSLEIQKIIVEKLDNLSSNIENAKKMVDEYREIIKCYVDCQTRNEKEYTFGNICETESGDYIKKADYVSGIYPIYGGGGVSKYINKTNRKNTFVISKDGVSEKCVRYIYGDFFLNHHGWTLIFKNEKLQIKKYIYYWLLTNENKLFSLAKGSAQKGINRESFYRIILNIPSIEKQKEIVDYCDNISNLISNIGKQTDNNKILMKDVMNSYLNQQTVKKSEKEIVEINKQKIEDSKKKFDETNSKFKKLEKVHEKII